MIKYIIKEEKRWNSFYDMEFTLYRVVPKNIILKWMIIFQKHYSNSYESVEKVMNHFNKQIEDKS